MQVSITYSKASRKQSSTYAIFTICWCSSVASRWRRWRRLSHVSGVDFANKRSFIRDSLCRSCCSCIFTDPPPKFNVAVSRANQQLVLLAPPIFSTPEPAASVQPSHGRLPQPTRYKVCESLNRACTVKFIRHYIYAETPI